jgi:hypothetical protein
LLAVIEGGEWVVAGPWTGLEMSGNVAEKPIGMMMVVAVVVVVMIMMMI